MAAEETLKLLDPDLAGRIRLARSATALREFAHECALLALHNTGVNDAVIKRALSAFGAREAGEDTVQLRQEVAAIVERMDKAAFDLRDEAEAGHGSFDAYRQSFAAARSVASLEAALRPDALVAAAEACYEAIAARVEKGAIMAIASRLA